MKPRADLHTHSWYSDGSFPPAEVVAMAARAGVGALALTDHDTIAGIEEARAAGRELGLEVIAGVEFAARFQKVEVHVLGLWMDLENNALPATLTRLQAERRERAERMVEKLTGLGIGITMADVLREVGRGGIGRPHVAQALARIGAAATIPDAFTRYLAANRPAYVPHQHLTPETAVAAIHQARGLAVLAHPLIGGPQREHVRALAELGFDAIEYLHPKLSPTESSWLRDFARARGLALAAGSDFHGPGISEGEIGDHALDWENFQELYNRPRGGNWGKKKNGAADERK